MRRLYISFLVASCVALGACASGKTAQDDGGMSGDAGVGDGGVMIDAAPPPTGYQAHGTVSGGVKASSPNYKLIGTTGKGSGTSSSPNYRVKGGVVGATQAASQ